MSHNVVIKNKTAAHDVGSYLRTAKCASDLDNGAVFALDSYSTTDGEGMVWVATAPTAATATGLWMATSPEVVVTHVATGIDFKGIVEDPREFVNVAGRMIDARLLVVGDIVEMTGEGITNIATANYLIPAASSFTLAASATVGTGLCLKACGTGILHVGNGSLVKTPVTTYKFQVVKN